MPRLLPQQADPVGHQSWLPGHTLEGQWHLPWAQTALGLVGCPQAQTSPVSHCQPLVCIAASVPKSHSNTTGNLAAHSPQAGWKQIRRIEGWLVSPALCSVPNFRMALKGAVPGRGEDQV